ncbi:uncharacterized protein LOC108086406 [Drosophila ficusphila]|uniref:uncharacterized protein LOC108086406 n=1 Tax=Drosophila ficusphila TaxID=30025 RepID=UPI0007E62FA6|nr:uncharacterized protein LOC108086406 [Drosophila ficusphila]
MGAFEQHLNEIAAELYGLPVHQDFTIVKNFVMDLVRENRLLSETCHVASKDFGSKALGIQRPGSDFDVMIVLEFPYYEDIFVRPDQHRPGMVHLDFYGLPCNSYTEDNLLDHRWYLKREEVQSWMQGILTNVHGRSVRGQNYQYYELRYRRGTNCHTITAESNDYVFSIDFVPAIKIHFDESDWEAIPKWAPGPKRSNPCTFMVSDVEEEIDRFKLGGENIRDAVVLLKALCEAKNLPKIRNYHLVSTALTLMDNEEVEDCSLQYVFLTLLYDLIDALKTNDLCSYFYDELDLLTNFNSEQLSEYANILNSAYSTLKTYPYQYKLSYERCSWHFLGDDDEDED